MLLGSLCAGTPDPGEQGVSPALADCLVSYELLLLQRKQQSQLLLNATFHEARLYMYMPVYIYGMCTACAPHVHRITDPTPTPHQAPLKAYYPYP